MLSKLIVPLRKWLAKKPSQAAKTAEIKESIWVDTGNIFYLENTLKLSYQGKYGKVTMENLNLESLPKVMSDLRDEENDSLEQAVVAGQKDAFCISICAVTWQKNGDSTRIKAVPEAAMLRSKETDFKNTQAVFKHEFMLEHDDLLSMTNTNKNGVFTYRNISISQFVQQIEYSNNAIAPNYKRQLSVKQENFNSAFTEHESDVIESVLEAGEQTLQLK